ncbi:MAG: 3-deoxy-D-manno-octulosonic acid transferase [Betaproteobacteria bacterium]|nr:3-deoxy-D-manno-octulosonic acid transferase [Betaproteobacteria bacterium]
MTRPLYTFLLALALPLILARLWWRGRREPGYRRLIGERFGYYDFGPDRPVVWVHAVSVGEVRAAAPLVRALVEEYPDHQMLVTCMTAAGRDTVKQVYGESVLAAFLPYDFPGAMQRLIERFRPRLAVLMETEVWPNMLQACVDNGVGVMLANARMSEKSERGYAKRPQLFAPAFGSLGAVCAQSEADAARLRALGAKRVAVAGNIKFDVVPDAAKLAEGKAYRERIERPILLFASTREGEEVMLLDALAGRAEGLIVAIVPRHPQRFDEVAALVSERGFPVARRSADEVPRKLLLGDTMGEMAFYYGLADVAVIGGSFQPLGGQNLIEACAAGVPVVIGPSVYNFSEATRLALEARAAVQADDAVSAIREALALLEDPARCAAMGEAGRKLCEAHRGATARHLAVAKELITAPARG